MRLPMLLVALAMGGPPAIAQSNSVLLAPADPRVHGEGPGYRSVTAGLKRFGVVEPKDWIELNRAVGPQGRADGSPNGPKRDGGAR